MNDRYIIELAHFCQRTNDPSAKLLACQEILAEALTDDSEDNTNFQNASSDWLWWYHDVIPKEDQKRAIRKILLRRYGAFRDMERLPNHG